MAYITLTDLQTRYGAGELIKLADRNGDNVPDQDVVDAAIVDAESVIDSHLAGGYVLPLNPVPSLIVRLACSIARYHLYDDNPAEKVREDYEAAKLTLHKISTGELKLISEGGGLASPGYSEGEKQFNAINEY